MEKSKLEGIPDIGLNKYVTFLKTLIVIPDDITEFYELFDPNSTLGKKLNAPLMKMSRLDIEYLFHYIHFGERPELREESVEYVETERVTVYRTRRGDVPTYINLPEGYLETVYSNGELDEVDDWDVEKDIDWGSSSSYENGVFYI